MCTNFTIWARSTPFQQITVKLFRFCCKSLFMKLFKTSDMQVVEICREQFDFVLPSLQLDYRRRNFISSQVKTDLVKFFLV